MTKTAVKHAAPAPKTLDRIVAILGSQGALARALDVKPNYPTKWKHLGYIPTEWAIEIHELRLRDEWGPITAMDVLEEYRRVRRSMILEAGIPSG